VAAKTKTPKRSRRKSSGGVLDANVVKALAHPLRVQLLARLNERVASPNELAQELGERLPNVSYHVRTLLDLGCIELVSTAQRRGAVEHYYRALVRPFFNDADWAAIPPSARGGISGVVLREMIDDASAALAQGTFDMREDRHLSRVHLVLDEEGWQELNKRLLAVLEGAMEISSQSAGRLNQHEGEGAIRASLAMMLFPLADP
jgi:DNA-binding transcriptional ArsR family regulator